MAWGTGGWGVTPWGTATSLFAPAVDLYFTGAIVTSTHTVKVSLSAPPLFLSAIGEGDASNPATWSIVNTTDSETIYVIAVRKVSSTDYELATLQAFGNFRREHTVSAPGMLDARRNPIIDPTSMTFRGVEAARFAPRPLYEPVDYASTELISATDVSGALRVGSHGGYAMHGGVEMLKKLIIRRLTTAPGAFFHLPAEDYGLGLKLKEPVYAAGDLDRLRGEIIRQVKREPDVADATATLEMDRRGFIKVVLRVKSMQSGWLPEFTVTPER